MYTFETRIRYSETDCNKRLTIEALLDYFQDCSTFHSEDMGIGMDYLEKLHRVWVLNLWQIDVTRLPKACERVMVGTAPYEFKGFLGYRNFVMKDQKGEILAKANTLWSLFDLDNNRPARPTDEMLEKYVLEPKLDMEYLPRKIVLPQHGEDYPEITVATHHLDSNHHVNNGQYVRMALECIGNQEETALCEIKRMRVEYKRQAFLGDKVFPILYRDEEKNIVSLNADDGQPYAIAEFTYSR